MEDSRHGNSLQNATADIAHTEIARTLLQIWSEVLNAEAISIHDDFFNLGGDSMAAMRCINRINAMFGVELPLDLFLLDSASIVQVASEIARVRA